MVYYGIQQVFLPNKPIMAENKGPLMVLVVVGIVIAIIIALITSSYSDLHYYEVGFRKSKTTGAVSTNRVYTGGRRWLGPTATFKKFNAYGQQVIFNDSTVFAAPDPLEDSNGDETTGASLIINVGIHIIYFIIPEDLKLLHDEYDVNYHPIIVSSSLAAIKDTASKFTLKQFYREREQVEEQLLLGVQQRLSGMCCPVDCDLSNCFAGCIKREDCTSNDKGLFVDARYLQLTNIRIPYEVEHRNLKTLIITEETAEETFTQQAAVIEKETEQKVQQIQNKALEVTANSTAQAALIAANSQANYRQILESARREGLTTLFNSVGLSTVEHKNSFDYLRSLADNNNAHLTVDFDQLIMGPTNLP